MSAPAGTTVSRWQRSSRAATGGAAVLLVLLALVPLALGPDTTNKLTQLFVLVVLAVTWNALAGAGLVSVGQQAFIGIGAYATVLLADSAGVNPYLAVVGAAALAGAVSLPVSVLAFRLRGGQFAIGMWVIAETVRLIATQVHSLGGGTGRSLRATNVYEPALRQAYAYWTALTVTAVLLVGVVVLLRSRLGLSLQAIRDDEVGAGSLGVRVTAGKRWIFLVAAAGAGAAGAVIALNSLTVQPASIFGVQWSAYMIFMVLLGGIGTVEGPVLGAIVFFAVQQEFADQGAWYLVGLGVLAVVVTLVAPRGLWGSVVDRTGVRLVPVGYRVRTPAPAGVQAPSGAVRPDARLPG